MRATQAFQPSRPRSASRTASSTVCVTGPGRAAKASPTPCLPERCTPAVWNSHAWALCRGASERAWPSLLRWPRGTLGPHPEATRLCTKAPTSPACSALSSPSNPAQATPVPRASVAPSVHRGVKNQDAQLPSQQEAPRLFSPAPPAEPRRGWRHARALCAL